MALVPARSKEKMTKGQTMETVAFTRMDAGTKEEYEFLSAYEHQHFEGTADRVLEHLALLRGSIAGYKIDRFEHCLQTATRAHRDGADEEMVVAALLHDIGDMIAPTNHSDLAAAVLRPYVSERTYWVVKYHGLFQAYYYAHHFGYDRNERDRFKDHEHYQACVDFCQNWDQAAFDPDYDTLPIEFFEPMVRQVFSDSNFRSF